MDMQQIYTQLQNEFGANFATLVLDHGDPYLVIDRTRLSEIAHYVKNEPTLAFDFLESITGVELPSELQVIYHLFSYTHRHALILKVCLHPDDLQIPSVQQLWPAANWHEREQYDLFGFEFVGHPELSRLLLPADWVGHPLRKNYQFPTSYQQITCSRP